MIIVGAKFYGHDSAACIIDTGARTIVAASTERFTRIKHDGTFCTPVLEHLLAGPADVVAHAFADFQDRGFQEETSLPGLARRHLDAIRREVAAPRSLRELEVIDDATVATALAGRPDLAQRWRDAARLAANGPAAPEATRAALAADIRMRMAPFASPQLAVEFHDHHLCHAHAAIIPSPFYGRRTLVVTLDGQGDGAFGQAYVVDGTAWRCVGVSRALPLPGLPFPASLGWVYSIFTLALGFRPSSDEGKVEALAAFGRPIAGLLDELQAATTITDNSIGFDPARIRTFLDPVLLTDRLRQYAREDAAATVQHYLEEAVISYLNRLAAVTDCDRLTLVGGVAANIVLNLGVFERTPFRYIHVCPFMGDEGTAVGAAVLSALTRGEDISWLADQTMPYWGTSYSREAVWQELRATSGIHVEDMVDQWITDAAGALASNRIIAVYQGRMEFGPRALGHRSILANPADATLRERMNVAIKRRPPWQPFCPSVLESERERLFTRSVSHRHMAIAFRVRPEHIPAIPSAVHVDGTARPQFVSPDDDPALFALLTDMHRLTGYGLVINTSFNLHGRTIVEAPSHAIDDFLACNLDALYIEGYKVTRA